MPRKVDMLATALMMLVLVTTSFSQDNQLSQQEKKEGWELLFNGQDLTGWKCNNGKPVATKVEDGGLVPFKSGGSVVIHENQYDDFVLKCDVRWEAPKCNSGIFFRVEDPSNPVHTGFEVQVMSGDGVGKHDFGAIYDLAKIDENAGKKTGQWNSVEIRCLGPSISVKLNGKNVCAINCDQYDKPGFCPDGKKHKYKLNKKPRAVKDFARKGYLGFQDHGAKVWYKNVKVLPLKQSKQKTEDPPRQKLLKPTHANVSYGPHASNVIDFYSAPGTGRRPLLVYIHGGGWIGGDKKQNQSRFKPFLDKGISYAAVNYRLTGEAPLPAPVHDAARAIQFIRSKADQWNIDASRIALTGGSAGACTSMWILLHDDLADSTSEDPVLRESTRVTAAAVAGGQTSIDPEVIEGWLGPNVLKHRMINMAVGEPTIEGALKNYAQHSALYKEFSPYNHVDKNDPPLYMSYGNNMKLPSENAGHGIHHPVYGVKLAEKSKQQGHECYLLIRGVSQPKKYSSADEFLMSKLLDH